MRGLAILLVSGAAMAVLPLSGAEAPPARLARIISLQNDIDTAGAFSYSYETENGIKAEARGILKNAGVPDKEEQVVTGSYSFVDNGKLYSVTYVADGGGFRAFGDHIPSTAPSLPPSYPPLPPHSPHSEVEDLARSQWDPQGLSPPPPPPPTLFLYPPASIYSEPLSADFVRTPSTRNPRRRRQELLDIMY